MSKRNWVFTLNNPEEEPNVFADRVERVTHFRYLVFQKENGENGTDHYQGYIEFTQSKRLAWLKRHVANRAHFEGRRGTKQQARDYSMKEDTRIDGPWERGEFVDDGQRTDVTAFKEAIKSGKRKRDLLDDYDLHIAKFPKFYETVRALYRPIRIHEDFVGTVLLYGWPGTGKTRYVVENYPDYWESPLGSGTAWYDGYDGHKIVLFDDFAGKMSKVGLNTTLKVLDRYPRQVPIKGGFTWWMPNLMFITTNIHPRAWYDWENREQQWPALKRRITHVYWYKRDGEVEYIEDKENFFDNQYNYEE